MSETQNNVHADPIVDALAVETPAIEKSSKKGMKLSTKVGIALGAASVVGLGLLSVLSGPEEVRRSGPSAAMVSVGDAPKNAASVVPTNPEAIEALKSAESKREAEAKKDPGKSFVTADPFGESKPSSSMKADDGQVALNPPPPPPPVQQQNPNGEQEDPTLKYARMIYADAIKSPVPGVSQGNTPVANVQQASYAQNANQITAQPGTPQYIQQQMAAGNEADIPAGVMLYARLTSQLNSLVPQTPPRAVVVGGRYDGAILLGAMENVENKYLVLRFNTMTLGRKTFPISAIAINVDAQDAGLADEVTSRSWERAALTAGVGFVQAFGAAKLQEGTTTVQNSGLNGFSSSTQTPTRSNGQTALIALGGAAQSLQQTAQQEIQKIKDEVKVNQNKEMGVLFTQPLYIQK